MITFESYFSNIFEAQTNWKIVNPSFLLFFRDHSRNMRIEDTTKFNINQFKEQRIDSKIYTKRLKVHNEVRKVEQQKTYQ